MTPKALSIFSAALLLMAGLALAQAPTNMDDKKMDKDMMSVTGTVVSTSSSALVVDTDAGQKTFQCNDRTNKPANLAVGDHVMVTYEKGAGDAMVATNVKVHDEGMEGKTSMAAGNAGSRGTSTAQGVETDTETYAQNQGAYAQNQAGMADNDALPQTASELPLLALLGLISLVGAAVLRFGR